ncbi:MAG: dihydrolipoamide acetyltransferase family protein, partial [Nanoarchaeota archaeon]
GEGITEGELLQWLVKIGDVVKEDQPIAKVETDKAVVEIPSPKSGTVLALRAQEGTTIKVGQVLMVIGEKGEQVQEVKSAPKKEQSVSVVGFLEEAEQVLTGKKDLFEEQPVVASVKALPKVRKLAEQLKVDITTIKGTGTGGQITEEDVHHAAEQPVPRVPKVVKKYDMYGYVEHIPLKGMRKTIAQNMVKSVVETASVTHTDEADVTDLAVVRDKEKIRAAKDKIKLTYLPFVMKALIATLKKYPYLNSSLETDEEGSEIIIKKYYNIGIGVDTPDGLMVFVIKGADQKSMLDLAKEIEDLSEKARTRTIDIGDLKGGTFTITNYGSVGGLYGTPIINPGECAILGLGKIVERPRVVNGQIVIRKILPLSVTFDHRIVDGAEVAHFVNTLIEHLEDPDLLLIEK